MVSSPRQAVGSFPGDSVWSLCPPSLFSAWVLSKVSLLSSHSPKDARLTENPKLPRGVNANVDHPTIEILTQNTYLVSSVPVG